jgi:hypothetical protein
MNCPGGVGFSACSTKVGSIIGARELGMTRRIFDSTVAAVSADTGFRSSNDENSIPVVKLMRKVNP